MDKSLNLNTNFVKKILKPGEWYLKKSGKQSDKLLLSTGSTYSNCIKYLKKKNFNYNWYSIPIWGMKLKNQQFKKLSKFKDHLQDGGFGSWVNEILSSKKNNKKIFVYNSFISSRIIGKVGSENYLDKLYGPK